MHSEDAEHLSIGTYGIQSQLGVCIPINLMILWLGITLCYKCSDFIHFLKPAILFPTLLLVIDPT